MSIAVLPSRAIALSVGPLAIHWYGVLYAVSFLIGMWVLPRLEKFRSLALTGDQRTNLYTALILGVVVGGRLGYVLFYEPAYFIAHPVQILAVWHGGMSSHGGLIGVVCALVVFCKRNSVSLLALADLIVVPSAIGLALGRLGNLINLELYGTVTALPWGIHIPGVEGLRHPTQIYAMIKDLFIAWVCFMHMRATAQSSAQSSKLKAQSFPIGRTTALFLILYGILRFVVEYFRDQPYGHVTIGFLNFSRGQLLTIPVFVAGVCLWCLSRPRCVGEHDIPFADS